MGRWLETYQTPEEILMTKFKSITTNLLAKYRAESPEFLYDFESFVKEVLTDEAIVERVFDILIRDVYKRTRRQPRAPPQGPASMTSPVGLRIDPVTVAAADDARIARFLQQHQSQNLSRSSINPRQTPVPDGEAPRADSSEYYRQLNRLAGDYLLSHGSRRIIDHPSTAAERGPIEELMWPVEVRVPNPSTTREEDKDEDTVVDTRDVGLGTVVV